MVKVGIAAFLKRMLFKITFKILPIINVFLLILETISKKDYSFITVYKYVYTVFFVKNNNYTFLPSHLSSFFAIK